MQERKAIKILYSILLFFITLIIWVEIYQAQFLNYDENWGNLITAFLISIGTFFGLIFMWLNWRKIILACKWQTLLFLLLSSPITIVIIVFNYKKFFGVALSV